ncbi:hypothetical protein PVAND_006855 [Polypedilum vanderplanki]|uniref:Major facilitator superfamily (MFS) profile domain-containing protein n=1 Tax=Polypedilum vanderplanki TaxID=319348 RepID=A0A9J6C505_POLVA|nr:hypothetical protein PVAND_006855 [Polypedilum vanderplanki]
MSEVLEKPNGGFGWIVVFGAFMINVFNQAFLSVFGLLFGGYLHMIHETKANIALVVNLSCLFINISGLFSGALLKKFSTRQICVTACLLTSLGVSLSSITTSLYQIIFTFSLICGIGLGLLTNTILIAVTSYFTTKNEKAVSFTQAGTGIGQILLPQILRFLIANYGYQGSMLIMGALMLNGIVGALLFQPVEWHMKNKSEDDYEREPLLPNEIVQIETINQTQSFWKRVANSMDLSLLKDSHFIILSFGLAIGYVVAVDFSVILPLFLLDTAHLNKDQTAMCLSILATFGIISRLTFHFITSKLKFSSQKLYVIGIILLMIIRSLLAQLTNYRAILFTCAVFGYFRALVIVNQVLIISDLCTQNYPEKFGGALGLNMIFKSLSIITFGQLLGFARDHLDSYSLGLHFENLLLVFILIIWMSEFFCKKQ